MVKGRERKYNACLYSGGIHTCICKQWDQYRLCCRYFMSVKPVAVAESVAVDCELHQNLCLENVLLAAY